MIRKITEIQYTAISPFYRFFREGCPVIGPPRRLDPIFALQMPLLSLISLKNSGLKYETQI